MTATRSLGEQPHAPDQCDREGRPHLGPCIEPGTRTAATVVDADAAAAALEAQHYTLMQPGQELAVGQKITIVLDDGTVHHQVVDEIHGDGRYTTVAELSPAQESLFRGEYAGPSVSEGESPDRRFVVDIPADAIPNGNGGWWLPGPPPPPDGAEVAGVDLGGWADAGYIDETEPRSAALGLEPHHARCRQRTDEEHAAVRARTCCVDASEGPDEDGVILHTLGCRNRCAVDVPCLDSGGRPGTYPCGATRGHAAGDHWVPPAARTLATGGVIPAEVADEMLARLETRSCVYPVGGAW